MKRIISAIIAIATLGASTYATYSHNITDQERVAALVREISNVIDGELPIQFSFVRQIETLMDTYNDPETRIHYVLSSLHSHFDDNLQAKKNQTKSDVITAYERFLRRHAGQVSNTKALPAGCFTYIDELDTLAYVHDISLPVLIATRNRERSCKYSLPSNTRGPMQIITKNYGSGAFKNHEQFIQTMEDYIAFIKEKYTRYNRVTDSGQPITIGYDDISYADIIKHGALYNGLGGGTIYGDIYPAAPSYVFDQFGEEYANAGRNGIMAGSIKVMQRWIANRK